MTTYTETGIEITEAQLENKLDSLMNDEIEVVTTKEQNNMETIYTVECGVETAVVSFDTVYEGYYTINIFDNRFNYGEKVIEFDNKLDAKKYAFTIYKKIVSNYKKRADMLNKEWKKQGII